MLRHGLFAAAVMLASTVGFAGVASADSATVTFDGKIDSVLSFDKVTIISDSLVQPPSSSNGTQDSLVFLPAQFSITCNAPGSISVGEPIPSPSNPASTRGYAYVLDQYGSTIADSSGLLGYINTVGSVVPLQIGMEAYNQNSGQALPAGNYQYTVILTAVGTY